jgi:ethanolamine utilization protein EutQ (cupin superfamily)
MKEFFLIMEGSLNCTVDGREYTASPGEAIILPANKSVKLSAKRQAIWFSLKLY